MIKTILGSVTTITVGSLHWLVSLTPELVAISTGISILVGIATLVYVIKQIIKSKTK